MTRLGLARLGFTALAILGLVAFFGSGIARVVWGALSPIHDITDVDLRDRVLSPIAMFGGAAAVIGSLGVLFTSRGRYWKALALSATALWLGLYGALQVSDPAVRAAPFEHPASFALFALFLVGLVGVGVFTWRAAKVSSSGAHPLR
ncbi:hypothetical protein LJR225_005081 [Phenylobacterium sp. LjRoot225]|uniref:hypothetical protein n=1 Tax=Phenylobacterium sp. LjRoot225 TaxID=3342285 RepID=UPI003ECFE1BF